ncbi:MAG: hypothetical protein KIT31_27495 [Deltaproteobacteria bacterium]|nr:hypothetical protein [Deltaproteobacteria bacterium]
MYQEHRIELGTLPRDTDAYLALRDRLATTPWGGAAMFVAGIVLYGEDRALAIRCLTAMIDSALLVDGPDGLQGKQPAPAVLRDLRDRLGEKPWIARSYLDGTSHERGYAPPDGPLAVRLREQSRDVGESDAKVFVFSSGADSPRPIRLLRNVKGIWKAREWSSLEVGVRAIPRISEEI